MGRECGAERRDIDARLRRIKLAGACGAAGRILSAGGDAQGDSEGGEQTWCVAHGWSLCWHEPQAMSIPGWWPLSN